MSSSPRSSPTRSPLYGLSAWAAGYHPALLGLGEGEAARLNDDRVGRCLGELFVADRASLLTALSLRAIRRYGIEVTELHNDSTSITLYGVEVRALHGHQRKSLCFGGFEAKYAAAFPRKARSLSCSATWRRSRSSSARSAELSGSPPDPFRVSMHRRSSRTHLCREFSTTDSSLATSRTDLPVSMTRCAASVLNSSVNRLLVAPKVTSSQPTLESAYRVSTFSGEPHSTSTGASTSHVSWCGCTSLVTPTGSSPWQRDVP